MASQPDYVGYVNTITQWWGDVVAEEIGASNPRGYNTIMLAFWLANQDGSSNPADVGDVWTNPEKYFDLTSSKYGSSPDEIRQNLRAEYHSNGAKVLISAFGATQFPTTQGIPATACGENLAQYVIDMQLDGVDLDYEDNSAMENGTAVPWLVEMTDAMVKKFKATGKEYLIHHAPQAPYFMDGKYSQNYVDLHNSKLSDGSTVGDHVHSYLLQFYNQGSSEYTTYTTIFETSDGWSTGSAVNQIAQKGIPLSKLVVGKPVAQKDVVNTGFVDVDTLAAIFRTARESGKVWAELGNVGGVMGWQFQSDRDGAWIGKLKGAIGN